jgi:hypothetical protein
VDVAHHHLMVLQFPDGQKSITANNLLIYKIYFEEPAGSVEEI